MTWQDLANSNKQEFLDIPTLSEGIKGIPRQHWDRFFKRLIIQQTNRFAVELSPEEEAKTKEKIRGIQYVKQIFASLHSEKIA